MDARWPQVTLVDDETRTWEMRQSFPVILDERGLVVGGLGETHSEALERDRGEAFAYDVLSAVQGQVTQDGELYVLPEGDMGASAIRLRDRLKEVV